MSDSFDTLTTDELERALAEQARELDILRSAATTASEDWRKLQSAWEAQPEIKAARQAALESEEASDAAEVKLRTLMLAYHERTGSTKFHKALEVRQIPTPVYDDGKMMDALFDFLRGLVTVNRGALNTWVKTNADAAGKVPLGFPALLVSKPSAAILSTGLAAVPLPAESAPYKPTVEETAAAIFSTSAEVKKVLDAVDDKAAAEAVPF